MGTEAINRVAQLHANLTEPHKAMWKRALKQVSKCVPVLSPSQVAEAVTVLGPPSEHSREVMNTIIFRLRRSAAQDWSGAQLLPVLHAALRLRMSEQDGCWILRFGFGKALRSLSMVDMTQHLQLLETASFATVRYDFHPKESHLEILLDSGGLLLSQLRTLKPEKICHAVGALGTLASLGGRHPGGAGGSREGRPAAPPSSDVGGAPGGGAGGGGAGPGSEDPPQQAPVLSELAPEMRQVLPRLVRELLPRLSTCPLPDLFLLWAGIDRLREQDPTGWQDVLPTLHVDILARFEAKLPVQALVDSLHNLEAAGRRGTGDPWTGLLLLTSGHRIDNLSPVYRKELKHHLQETLAGAGLLAAETQANAQEHEKKLVVLHKTRMFDREKRAEVSWIRTRHLVPGKQRGGSRHKVKP